MKITKLFIAIIAALIFASCSEDIETGDTRFVAKRFVAQTEKANESAGSRTQTLDGTSVVWSAGDKISVVSTAAPAGFKVFTLTSGEGTDNDAIFEGATFSDEEIQPYVAVYGTGTLTYDDGKVSGIVVPQAQRPVNNGFDPTAAPMTAYTTSEKVNFNHICSFIKVTVDATLADEHLKRVTFKAKNGETITGTLNNVSVNTTDGKVETYDVSQGQKSAYLAMENDADIPAGTYYIAVLPKNLTSGFSIEFETTTRVYIRKEQTTGARQLIRAKIHSLGSFEKTTTWNEDHNTELLYGGEFSVSSGQKVSFSSGNLWAVIKGNGASATVEEWKLAPNQWEVIGLTSGNVRRGDLHDGDKVSMFSYVSDGKYSDGLKQYGIMKSTYGPTDYYVDKSTTECDWGGAYKTSSGSSHEWRVLTRDEWLYLLTKGNGTSARNQEYCSSLATVHNQIGLVIFPDDFDFPTGFAVAASAETSGKYKNYYKVTIPTGTGSESVYTIFNKSANCEYFKLNDYAWGKLEELGCMFLPAEGYIYYGAIDETQTPNYGAYHSATIVTEGGNAYKNSFHLQFNNIGLSTSGNNVAFNYGRTVRLVSDK